MLIGDIARRNARRHPQKTAVLFGDTELSWSALDERANRLATYLLSRGLHPGDRVAVVSRNTAQWPEMIFAMAKAGLVLVPINVRLAPEEVGFILDDAGCRAAVVHADHIGSLSGVLAGLEFVVEIGEDSANATPSVAYETAIAAGRAVDPTPADLCPDDIGLLLYTSGTTGRPKGVVNEHRGLIAQVFDTTIVIEARPDDVFLALTPFFTAGGMVRTLSWLFLGQTMVIHPRFDPEATLAEIERSHVTMTTFIPTMLLRTLQALDTGPRRDLSSLRRISYGSAPSPEGLARRAMAELGCDLQQRYGQTEAGGQVTILTPEDHRAMLAGKVHLAGSAGRESPQSEVHIFDDDGNDLPSGEVGEIVLQADSMARGYWNRPEETAQTFRTDGLRTGDLGRLDEEGYLYVVGRKTDMIISGGFNVYPAEIERVIGTHPDVELVAVVGAPDPEWGETPVAVIVAKPHVDTVALQERLSDRCRSELAGYKQPRRFEFRQELPLTPAGKILKRELRAELYENDRTANA